MAAEPATGVALPLRVALVYDMDACRGPTGVTRHALAQLERLAQRPDVALRWSRGGSTEPDGLAYWESLGDLPRRELPVRTRDAPAVVAARALAAGRAAGRRRSTGSTARPSTASRPARPGGP